MNDRLNTIFGWVLFSGIVALGLSSISGKVFHADKPERPEQLGYAIQGVVEEGADEGPSLAALLAGGSAANGESSFAKCSACHTITQGGANGIGPNLWAIMGQPIGSHMPGFAYSSALAEKGGTWTFEAMDEWLTSPRAFANGTKMSFAGLSDPQERADIMLFMLANGGGLELPAVEAAPAAEGETPAEGDAAAAAAEGAAAEGAEGEAAAGAEGGAAAPAAAG